MVLYDDVGHEQNRHQNKTKVLPRWLRSSFSLGLSSVKACNWVCEDIKLIAKEAASKAKSTAKQF